MIGICGNPKRNSEDSTPRNTQSAQECWSFKAAFDEFDSALGRLEAPTLMQAVLNSAASGRTPLAEIS